MTQARLRMFAGPNGSGKSTIKEKISAIDPQWLGVYINPDEIQKSVKETGQLDFTEYGLEVNERELFHFLSNSTQLLENDFEDIVRSLSFQRNSLSFDNFTNNAYLISALADFLHEQLIRSEISFSIETVMSHPQKIVLLKESRKSGFRSYLYYVATEDPEINISRVATRVNAGGHDVPREKIISRYYQSLENLLPAIHATNRAFVFDNSGTKADLIAEISYGKSLEVRNSVIPNWFRKYVLDKGINAP